MACEANRCPPDASFYFVKLFLARILPLVCRPPNKHPAISSTFQKAFWAHEASGVPTILRRIIVQLGSPASQPSLSPGASEPIAFPPPDWAAYDQGNVHHWRPPEPAPKGSVSPEIYSIDSSIADTRHLFEHSLLRRPSGITSAGLSSQKNSVRYAPEAVQFPAPEVQKPWSPAGTESRLQRTPEGVNLFLPDIASEQE